MREVDGFVATQTIERHDCGPCYAHPASQFFAVELYKSLRFDNDETDVHKPVSVRVRVRVRVRVYSTRKLYKIFRSHRLDTLHEVVNIKHLWLQNLLVPVKANNNNNNNNNALCVCVCVCVST